MCIEGEIARVLGSHLPLIILAGLSKLADETDSKSVAARRMGSSPITGIRRNLKRLLNSLGIQC